MSYCTQCGHKDRILCDKEYHGLGRISEHVRMTKNKLSKGKK